MTITLHFLSRRCRPCSDAGSRRFVLLLIGWSALSVVSGSLEADLIRLKNGGELRGTLERRDGAASRDELTMITLTGARVTVRRDDVEFVTPRPLKVEAYETRARAIPETVEAHWELAEWCREQRLPRQREEQLERIIEIDPNYEAARRGLGHTLHGAKWMSRHEAMLADGYIRHNGRYVTQQELDLIEKTQAQRDAEQKWFEKVRLWFTWASGRPESRMAEGRLNLERITDPAAIPALAKVLSDHEDVHSRRLFVNLLGRMGGSEPVALLVRQSLLDSAPELRTESLQALDGEQRKAALQLYVDALGSDLRLIVCRAGAALGEIGDPAAVPALINALITEHKYRVTYQEPTQSYALGGDGSIGFPGSTSGLPLDVEILARTGQLPYGAVVVPPPGGTVMKSAIVKRREENLEVLNALKKLTNQNFGFDQRTWQLWWAAQQNAAPGPVSGE